MTYFQGPWVYISYLEGEEVTHKVSARYFWYELRPVPLEVV